ncbi:MAG: tetratricopeptide repeat protein [Acidobacteriaceae bacterium]|nr:tetratricopeptide repeat protein [Acidobacteriaceae bacterium]
MVKQYVTGLVAMTWLLAGPLSAQTAPPGPATSREVQELRQMIVDLQNQLKLVLNIVTEMNGRAAGKQPGPAPAADPNRLLEAQKAFQEGVAAEQQQKFPAAIERFATAIQLDPGNDSAFLHRGNAYLQLGDSAHALADFLESLRLQPNNSRAYQARADAYLAEGKYELALTDLNQALERDAHNAVGLTDRARVYQALGKYDQALDDCRKAIELSPRLEKGLLCRATALFALGRPEEALPDLKTVLQMNPGSSSARALLEQFQVRTAAVAPPTPPPATTTADSAVTVTPTAVVPGAQVVTAPVVSEVVTVPPVAGVQEVKTGMTIGTAVPQAEQGAPVKPNAAPKDVSKPVQEVKEPEPMAANSDSRAAFALAFPLPGAPAIVVDPAPVALAAGSEQADRSAPAPHHEVNRSGRAPSSLNALLSSAKMHIDQEDFRGSLPLLDQAIQIDGTNFVAYNTRGYAYLRLRKYSQAIEDFRHAVDLNHDYANAAHNLTVAEKLNEAAMARRRAKIEIPQ